MKPSKDNNNRDGWYSFTQTQPIKKKQWICRTGHVCCSFGTICFCFTNWISFPTLAELIRFCNTLWFDLSYYSWRMALLLACCIAALAWGFMCIHSTGDFLSKRGREPNFVLVPGSSLSWNVFLTSFSLAVKCCKNDWWGEGCGRAELLQLTQEDLCSVGGGH